MDEIKQEKSDSGQAPVTKKSLWSIHFWPVVIAVMLTTGLLVGIGTYWQMQSNKRQAALEGYIEYLENLNNAKR